jgi:hypothetical protein
VIVKEAHWSLPEQYPLQAAEESPVQQLKNATNRTTRDGVFAANLLGDGATSLNLDRTLFLLVWAQAFAERP